MTAIVILLLVLAIIVAACVLVRRFDDANPVRRLLEPLNKLLNRLLGPNR